MGIVGLLFRILEFIGRFLPRQRQPEPAPLKVDDPLPDAAVLAEQFEGFVPHPYQDPVGIWTIGYGSIRDLNGHSVTADTPPVSETQANSLMMRDLRQSMDAVARDVNVVLTHGERVALMDFVYNEGEGNLLKSTLLRKLNAGDFPGAATEFDKWDMAGGRVMAGLLRRRQAETDLFLRK